VAAHSDRLGAWTVGQVTHLDAEMQVAALLEFDWSGDKPHSLDEVGDLRPLRLSHHAHTGRVSHCFYEWLLPRSYEVIGHAPPMVPSAPNAYGAGWHLGDQLARQQRWDAGERDDDGGVDPHFCDLTAAEVEALGGSPRPEVLHLHVGDIDRLDCATLVETFPGVTRLDLVGRLGLLDNAGALQGLRKLRSLAISDLFGMTADDVLVPTAETRLESLCLYNIPAEYAARTRRLWKPEAARGTYAEILGARQPEWVEENRGLPLRDWDTRDHITPTQFRKSVAQWKATRAEVLEALDDQDESRRVATLRDAATRYAIGFNELDERRPFIETEEREDLVEALLSLVEDTDADDTLSPEGAALLGGVNAARTW
jgi:hypothetical protein